MIIRILIVDMLSVIIWIRQSFGIIPSPAKLL